MFLGIALGLYALWYVLYEGWLGPDGSLDAWLSIKVARAGAGVLGILGYETAVRETTIMVAGKPTVFIGNPCNGLAIVAVFAGLIAAFPGPARKKLYFIPLGALGILLINVVRVAALAVNHIYSQGSVDFNHKYTFSFVVYAFIFAMWVIWVKKFSNLESET